jgi:uncharacterized membrane protein
VVTHPEWTHALFSDDDLDAIGRAVTDAEAGTSAEIRVHVEARLPRSLLGAPVTPLARARRVFALLGMHRTAGRNGVLIYLALRDRQLALVGDDGIHARVGVAYWERLRDILVEHLARQEPREALLAALRDLGAVLREHFPRRPDDVDELPDTVSTG